MFSEEYHRSLTIVLFIQAYVCVSFSSCESRLHCGRLSTQER